jgi:signal peptidase I
LARARTVRVLWGLAASGLLLLLAKVFVADVYRVDSGSMRPTLFGGQDVRGGEELSERVLVRYERDVEPRRFDMVVMRARDAAHPIIKRVAGLPGETLSIVAGDLLIGGRRLPPDAPRSAPVPLFDDRWLDAEDYFHYLRGEESPWRREGQEWVLDGTGVERGSDEGMMFFHKDLCDGYLDDEHRRVVGLNQVGDGVLELELRIEEPRGVVRLQLVEEGDTFRLLLAPREGDGGGWAATLTRHNPATLERTDPARRIETLAAAEVALAPGRWHRARFANVDDHLRFELDDRAVLGTSYAGNEPHRRQNVHERSVGPRVAFGGEGCRARFRSLRVLRDLHYTASGDQGVRAPISLGPDEVFLLGDNSDASTDSRHFGPVRTHELVGRPFAVVWPLGRVRWLEPVAER